MTEREKEVFKIISENPMISQNDLAGMLGIARSSVAVLISNLVQEGVLKGRGYIINRENHPVIIGSANADFYCKINRQANPLQTVTSRFLDISFEISYGGIAKNVAEGLVRLGSTPTLIAAVGTGLLGSEIIRDCKDANISTADIITFNENTAAYIEVQDCNGKKLLVGLSNANMEKNLSPENLHAKRALLNNGMLILMEDGMSIEALQYVSSSYQKNRPMLLCTYPERCYKYRDFLNQFSFAVMSDEVASELAGCENTHPAEDFEILRIARKIAAAGLTQFLIVFGFRRMCLYEHGRCTLAQFDIDYAEGDTTYDHCRDTIAAAIIKCFEDQSDAEQLLLRASAARYLASQTYKFVYKNLCMQLLSSVAQRGKLTLRSFD